MARQIYVNLPVKDLDRAKKFWSDLGFTFNPEYSDDKACCLVLGDNIFAMLLVEEFFATFINNPIADAHSTTEVTTCLSAETKAEVDETVAKAIAAGGKPWKPAFAAGPMYGGSFQDPDGHVWELMCLDAASA